MLIHASAGHAGGSPLDPQCRKKSAKKKLFESNSCEIFAAWLTAGLRRFYYREVGTKSSSRYAFFWRLSVFCSFACWAAATWLSTTKYNCACAVRRRLHWRGREQPCIHAASAVTLDHSAEECDEQFRLWAHTYRENSISPSARH